MHGDFTHIVVGAGTAGCVIAARLTEEPTNRVLVIEAGGRDWNPMLHIPIGTGKLLRSGLHGWKYVTDPIAGAGGRTLFWPRGKVLGGSSSLNGLVYIRGFAEEYRLWVEAGARGWSYREVLPYFLRAEGHRDRGEPWHGRTGPHRVRKAGSANPLYEAFLRAGSEAGFPLSEDFNGPSPEGFGRWDFTIDRGRRSSAATAFLRPALSRPNLVLITNAQVARVLLEGRRAVGVDYLVGSSRRTARASAEIILAGGVIGSPHLLQLSGIGDPARLTAAGIEVKHALAGVGANLQDHACVALRFAARGATTLHDLIRLDRAAIAMLQALAFRTGPATEFPVEGGAFTRSRPDLPLPDLQWYFNLGLDVSRLRVPGIHPRRPGLLDRPGFSMLALLLRPESRGRVDAVSSDPRVNPRLTAGYLDAPADLAALCAGVGQIRRVAAAPSLARYIELELAPGSEVAETSEIEAWIRANVGSSHHQAGSCRMGEDADAVVDPELRVHGIDGLRVADASVMPVVTSGGTYAASIMIGERAADFALQRPALAPIDLPSADARAAA